ncbi:hypothetical protein AA0116_g13539 [Alternaria tenuissima]|nr:hypothetical protein AA0116_g13539 [Alternaria tenuissima]
MPKGKPKKDNPALYGGSPEPSEPSTTRYAAVHRRGGTHKVRDEHKTDSKYDNYNYKELVDQAKERGIYRKDMKKVEMAWALKHDGEEERRAEQDAVLALQRKRQEAKEEEERRAAHKQRQIEEKHERRIEKERRRQRDESVSDDTLSDADIEAQETSRNEYAREQFGHALSDESWNSTSTESSPEPPMDRDTKPDCRLRLFEWPHEQLPDTHPPRFFSFSEPKPRAIPYAPLRLTTTSSKQKLVLPGSKYPTGVDPDFCPLLSPATRFAARNGHLIGTLRHAVAESGVHWAQRTLVQGWNAHMYFHLGSRHHNESKRLADTYRKWGLENRKVLRVKGTGEARKEERAARHVQRRRNRTRLVQEVYESSLWRPGGMGYVAAYLDYHWGDGGGGEGRGTGRFGGGGRRAWEKEEERVLENLFFVRFLGCDVPHYYFWSREGEWGDPCFPNPAWEAAGQLDEDEQDAVKMGEDAKGGKRRYRLGSKNRVESLSPVKTRLIRVRRPSSALSFTTASSPPSSPVTIASAITRAEYHLYTHGLSFTLSAYRTRWLAKGKTTHWKTFAANLPTLWPSGNIPDVPPVESRPGACLALKIATIDVSSAGGKTMFSPLVGGEAWTGDDDKLWEVVEVVEGGEDREDDDDETGDESDEFDGDDVDADEADGELEEIGYGNDDEVLYRRGSMVFAHNDIDTDPVMAWLDKISPTFAPSTTPKVPKVLEVGIDLDEWEERYL